MLTSWILLLLLDGLPAEDARLFAWYDRLTLPEVRERFTFGRTASDWGTAGGEKFVDHDYGFLVERDQESFTMLVGHRYRRYELNRLEDFRIKPEPEGSRAFEPLDLDVFIEEWFVPRRDPERPCRGSSIVAMFPLARHLAALGRPDAARTVMECIREQDEDSRDQAWHVWTSLGDRLRDQLAQIVLWEIYDDIARPPVPREELLRRLRLVVRKFDGARDSSHAAELARQLRLMTREDRRHRPVDTVTWNASSREEKVEELIYLLRDQNGRQRFWPGECDIFATGMIGTDSPAHRLAEMGGDAVPALLEILDDRRLTRSIGFHRPYNFERHYVLRYGDCAIMILERIAGRRFRDHSEPYPTRSDAVAPVRRAIESWWRGVGMK